MISQCVGSWTERGCLVCFVLCYVRLPDQALAEYSRYDPPVFDLRVRLREPARPKDTGGVAV